MNQDILHLIKEGQYLIAIKRYREVFQVGFSEAEKAQINPEAFGYEDMEILFE